MLNKESRILVLGMNYTLGEFADEFCGGDIVQAEKTFNVMVNRGQASLPLERKSKAEVKVERALAENETVEKAQYVRQTEERAKDKKAEAKREGRLLHEEITVDYPSLEQAKEHKAVFEENLRLKDIRIGINEDTDMYELIIRNVSDKDIDYISRTIKTDAVIGGAVSIVDKGITGTTKAIDYTAKKVVSPTIAIATKGTVSLVKTLGTTLVKSGATAVYATAEGGRKAIHEMQTDGDVLKAREELIGAKNAIRRGASTKFGSTSSRIKY